jgi:glycosyltransferase involved in cell wall biosynthesis
MAADIVVTSGGILSDAKMIEWPERLCHVQQALIAASETSRLMLVESTGCIPEIHTESVRSVIVPEVSSDQRPYVLFAGRPVVSKGIGFYQAIAARMSDCGMDFVAVGNPSDEIRASCRNIRWIPWLPQAELYEVMSRAAAVLHPSVTEGYGLSAVESCQLNGNVYCHDVGGLQELTGRGLAASIDINPFEREALYALWSELLSGEKSEYWNIWQTNVQTFGRLIDQWVEKLHNIPARPRMRKIEGTTWAQELLKRTAHYTGSSSSLRIQTT